MKVLPIPSCDGYYAGEDGFIYSKRNFNRFHTVCEELKPLKPHKNGGRYFGVTVCIHSKRRYRKIHRLVFEAFHGSCEGLQVHHKDGDPTNNHPDNLVALTTEAHREEHDSVSNAISFLTRQGYTVTKG